ncbi:carbohydrate ABC transporter permease [Paenibacillus harenae]|uniref:ABC-type sugar transport system permease subunit n=1 Tax=Paenibacillus harenae TaxID=306543 RepID=A0ABT9TZ55_PAEHA|nr:sugar ABC transporter permease [Paenibacillus harenae]MDQ0112287.1 ABC-type sugar transport system permease subunit [Paenibacillus harenae]
MGKKLGLSMRGRHILEGYSFISIWIIGFLLFMLFPLGVSLYYSFNNLEVTQNGLVATYAGFEHYRAAFATDIDFRPFLQSTVTTMLTQVPLILIFSMMSALLLNRQFRGRMLFRGIFFLPVIIASGAILRELLEQGAAQLPIFYQSDLYTKLSAFIPDDILEPILMYAESLTMVMWDSGVQILIFIAGLQTISPSLYEAAKCDGATKWESFWKITFPMIMPMLFVNTLYSIVNSFTKPDNKIMDYINNIAFKSNNYAYGSAMGWIYFIVISIILAIVFFIFRRSLSATEGRR